MSCDKCLLCFITLYIELSLLPTYTLNGLEEAFTIRLRTNRHINYNAMVLNSHLAHVFVFIARQHTDARY